MKSRSIVPRVTDGFTYYSNIMLILRAKDGKIWAGLRNRQDDYFELTNRTRVDELDLITKAEAMEIAPHLFK